MCTGSCGFSADDEVINNNPFQFWSVWVGLDGKPFIKIRHGTSVVGLDKNAVAIAMHTPPHRYDPTLQY